MTAFRVPIQLERRSRTYRTGATVVDVGNLRIVSMPSMLGCPVGCTFCISSSQPYVDRLPFSVLHSLYQEVTSGWHGEIELSWTGEGEPLLNQAAILEMVSFLSNASSSPIRVRVAFSGVQAERMLLFVRALKTMSNLRVLCSLHTMDQAERNALIPRSQPLDVLRRVLEDIAQVSPVECNMVHGLSRHCVQWQVNQFAQWMPDRNVGLVYQPKLGSSQEALKDPSFHDSASHFAASCVKHGIAFRVLHQTAGEIQPWYHDLTYVEEPALS